MITTTVTAHTGSTKFGTYKVVTGELREWRRRELGPNHYTLDAVIVDADGVEYVTGKGRIIEMSHEVVAVVEEAAPVEVEAAPEPRTIRFERVCCGRCKGLGRRSDNGWGANHHGVCYRCHGVGTVLTSNGYRASEAYRTMRDDRLGTTYGELAEGEVFKHDGKYYRKGEHPNLIIGDGIQVHRHNGPVTRQMWKEIAARYKGATLEY